MDACTPATQQFGHRLILPLRGASAARERTRPMVSCLKWAKCLSIGREGSGDRPAVGLTALDTVGASITWSRGRRTRRKVAALAPDRVIRLSLLVACALFIPPLATV